MSQGQADVPMDGIEESVLHVAPTLPHSDDPQMDTSDERDLYTAGTGGQISSPHLDVTALQNNTVDKTHLQTEGISDNVVTKQPLSTNRQEFHKTELDNKQASSSSSSGVQQMTPNGFQFLHAQNPSAQIMQSDNQNPSAQIMQSDNQASSSNSDDQKKNQVSKDWNTDTAGDEMPHPLEPLDKAEFKIKVDWTEPFPDRWRAALHKALQSWLSTLEGKPSVLSVKLMEDKSCAEVQITPSTAVGILKNHTTASLKFKDNKDGKQKEDKGVTAHIYLGNAHFVSVPQKSLLEENKAPSSKMNSSMPVTSAESSDVEDVAASNKAPNKSETIQIANMTPETPATFPLPFYLSWYMHHAFSKELEQIREQHGVTICAEVSVSIKPTQRSSPDSVSKASVDFQNLAQTCGDSFSDAAINHNDMDSDTVKQAIHAIQREDTKIMFTMSAGNGLFFGPKKFIDVIKRDTTTVESQFNDKSSPVDVDNNISPQSRPSLEMDTKDLPIHIEMDKIYWDLIKLSYEEQLSQLETKYSVSFKEEKTQKNVIKVQARSKGFKHFNLESHALRALTHLYQKLASAAVSCELKNPKHETTVAPTIEKLQQQHYCVVAADAFSPWKLVGLPEHLSPAIADIEKKLQKNVFDDKMKKLIGYLDDIPHARGIKYNQMPDYGAGAGRDERVNFRRKSEADEDFNEESKENSRYESKGAQAEEETCTICMDSFTNKRKLKCGHEFCQECIRMSVESLGSICPVCKEVFGKLEGNQPNGSMNVRISSLHLLGYPGCGTIEITYNIPDGIQTNKHPNPGKHYSGANRRAYLPDNREGNEVLELLQRAFKQKLIFTVGKSTTSGLDNVVTWNDIHHKTNTHGGPENYGYPDPDYLKRVKDELKAKGIE